MKVWLKAGVIIFYVLGYCFLRKVSANYCYVTHELRLHQNDRCKRFTPV